MITWTQFSQIGGALFSFAVIIFGLCIFTMVLRGAVDDRRKRNSPAKVFKNTYDDPFDVATKFHKEVDSGRT